MKKNYVVLLGAFLLPFFILCLVSCDDDDDGRDVIMTIAPEMAWTGTNPSSSALVRVMVGTVDGRDEKYYLTRNEIAGFEYTEGYEYKLRVRITPIKNPMADGDIESYELLEILSKEEVKPDTEVLPEAVH